MFRFKSPAFVVNKYVTEKDGYKNCYATVMIGSEKKTRNCPVALKAYEQLLEKTEYEELEFLFRDGVSKSGKPYTMLTIVE